MTLGDPTMPPGTRYSNRTAPDRPGDRDDTGYVLWALADDWITEHNDDEPVGPSDVYDWLVAQGRKLGAR